MDDFRAALDELMGKDRNLPPEQRSMRRARFYDKEVCKYALCGLCPYNLFFNTKSDLGGCEFEMHEEHLDFESCQAEWDALTQREKDKYGYERELLKVLRRLVGDMDRKIEKQQERARLESQPRIPSAAQQAELDSLKQQQKDLTERSAKLAEEGDVDGSLAAVQQADRVVKEHERLQKKYTEPERYIIVCEVCGVFIQSTDNEARRRDHIEGKQYLGWKAIREKCAELEQKFAGGVPPLVSGGRGEVGSGANAFPVSAGREHRSSGGGSRGERGERGEWEEGEFRLERSSDRDRNRERRSRHSQGEDRERERERGYDSRGREERRGRERERSYERDRRDRRGGAEVPPPDYRRSGSRGYY